MREKATCRICFAKFTRKWNMLKHMEKIHNVFEDFQKNTPFVHGGKQDLPVSVKDVTNAQRQQPGTALDKSLRWLFDMTRLSKDFIESTNTFQTIDYLKRKIHSYENEIADIKSNCLIIPNSDIQGLSGYLCRRCNSMGFIRIQNIGYDKTMQARHKCDEKKVKSMPMVSNMPLDIWAIWDSYNFTAHRMFEYLNSIWPGQKHLLAEDWSNSFDFLERSLNSDVVKKLLGFSDRYYYYLLPKSLKADWVNRVITNIGKKTEVEDFEIIDFLRRVSSTYAFFQIPTAQGIKRILIKITQ